MDAALPLATLLIAWPSLLPGWRAMLVGALLLGTLLALLLFIALDQLDRASGGEGPAFFAVVLLYGLSQGLLCCACIARVVVGVCMARLSPRRRAGYRRALWCVLAAWTGVATVAVPTHRLPAGMALALGTPLLWLCIAAMLPHPARHAAFGEDPA